VAKIIEPHFRRNGVLLQVPAGIIKGRLTMSRPRSRRAEGAAPRKLHHVRLGNAVKRLDEVRFVLYFGQFDRSIDRSVDHNALRHIRRQITYGFEAVALALEALLDKAPRQFSLLVFKDEIVRVLHLSPLPFE
jgi:hypothetical protein